jgi:hypothetical protein
MKQQQGKMKKTKVILLIFIGFRTSILCYVLYNGDTTASATWTGRYSLLIRF